MIFTRRKFLTSSASAAAVGVVAVAPAMAATDDPKERALHHWRAFVDSVQEMLPSDCRSIVLGSAHGFRVEAVRVVQEEIRSGITIPVDRNVAAVHYVEGKGWVPA